MVNYEEHVDSFAKKAHIASDLILGNPENVPNPWISYTVPTYKRPDFLKETLKSIIRQEEADVLWEIVVVDNEAGGENDTERMIRELNHDKILYYRNRENLLVDGNVNRCIELARGEWVAMVHADDLLISDHLLIMTKYIREYEHKGKKPLAYISSAYFEFSDNRQVNLDWRSTGVRGYDGMSLIERIIISREKNYDFSAPELFRFRQIDGLMTGTSVFLPSNGTIMNKKVMLETGGFNDTFGICTDLVKPYALAKDYRVYKTVRPFGFYRLGHENESRRAGAIHEIATACYYLTEYIYSKSLTARIWGNIARDERFEVVIKYMLRYSRFGNLDLTERDFDDIHICKKGFPRAVRKLLFKLVMCFYSRDTNVFFRFINNRMKATCKILLKEFPLDSKLIIYGAGRAGYYAHKYLKKRHPEIDIAGFAITLRAGNPDEYEDLPVYTIDELEKYKDEWYFLVTVYPSTQPEILEVLSKLEFKNVFYII